MKIMAFVLTLVTFLVLVGCSSDSNSPTAEDIALLRGIKNNDVQTVKVFLESKQYDMNKYIVLEPKNKITLTPLMIASVYGVKEVVALMLLYPIDINKKNNVGENALMVLSESGHDHIIPMVIFAGADINATDDDGNTALMYATKAGRISTVQLLVNKGANTGIKSTAWHCTAQELAVMLASKIDNPNKKSQYLEIYRFLKSH